MRRHTFSAAPSRLALLFATAMLASCGGGGGDSASAPAPTAGTAPAPVSSPSPSPSPAPAPTPAPAPASGSEPTAACSLPNFAAQALALVNQKRAAGASCGTHGTFAPAAALAWNAKLNQAATGHSSDMSALNYFSHTSQDGRTLSNRIDATGYSWSSIGENIAAGYPTVQAVVDGWMASDGHCANIMAPAFTEMGLACVPGAASSTYRTYWTMDLAKPR